MIRDDLNRVLDLRTPVRRIVSLAPVATENLFAIGAGALVVGVTTVCDYPDAARSLPKVGDFYAPVYEKIRALRPDVVVLDSGTITVAATDSIQERAQVPVYAQKSTTYDDVIRHIGQFGILTGRSADADKIMKTMRAQADEARALAKGKKPLRVFAEVSRSPLYAAGPGSFVDDLIRRAGCINVVRGNNPYPLLPREELLISDPDRYIVSYGADLAKARAEKFPAPLDKLRAVKTGNVIYLPGALLFRSTPRLGDGLLQLVRALHGLNR